MTYGLLKLLVNYDKSHIFFYKNEQNYNHYYYIILLDTIIIINMALGIAQNFRSLVSVHILMPLPDFQLNFLINDLGSSLYIIYICKPIKSI